MTQPRGIDCPHCGHRLPMHVTYPAGVTRRQGDVLNFIAQRLVNGEASPTMREIAVALGSNCPGRMGDIVKVLCQRGFLTGMKGRARSIDLTDKAWAFYRQKEVSDAA